MCRWEFVSDSAYTGGNDVMDWARQEATESRAVEKTEKEIKIKLVETCSLNCSLENFITQLLPIHMNLVN